MSESDIAFFAKRIESLHPRTTHKPGTDYESHVAKAEYEVTPNRDAITVDWNYYHAVISSLDDKKACDDWSVKGDCKYHVLVEWPGVARDGNHFCTVLSSGGYTSREECWRGLIARMRRVRK